MITHFINWVKGLFTPKKEEPIILEEIKEEKKQEAVIHCNDHNRFRKNCPSCLSAVGIV